MSYGTNSKWQLVMMLCLAALSNSAAESRAKGGVSTNLITAPPLRVLVDPRIELMSLLFRLAGNPEYNQGKVPSYEAAVEQQFSRFRDHDAVKVARQLRRVRGVSYDACISMAVHLDNASDLQLLVPLDPWPKALDRRWTRPDTKRFLEAARTFVKDASFAELTKQQRPLYELTEARIRGLMEKKAHLEWFQEFFGERPRASFTVAPGLLNGGSCYGARCKQADGQESLYCILGVWNIDADGHPVFPSGMIQTVVHEFGHSFANPVIDQHLAELRRAGDALFAPVADKMRSQAYSGGQTLLYESLVRACEVRYAIRYDGPAAGRSLAAYQKGRGFLWTQELSDVLGEYEAQREKYPTLNAFAPRLVAFFTEYAKGFEARQKELAAKRPKVISMLPENGAKDVDPNLKMLKVVFDRSMQGSYSLVGDPAECPEGAGQPYYDESRTIWTMPVKLRPDRTYSFMLNSETIEGFQSREKVPLEPVSVTFQTTAPK